MENQSKHSPTPWTLCKMSRFLIIDASGCSVASAGTRSRNYDIDELEAEQKANAHIIAAAPDLLEALKEGRRAIGDHFAPNDCYVTGPLTGDHFRNLIECPACSFIKTHDAAIAKAEGRSE